MTTPQDASPLQGAGKPDQDEAMAKWFRVEDTEREADNRRAGHFHAYYYGFDLTGEDAIDLVLRQVCRAGKAFHSTQEWNETYGYDGESSEADQIQEAARRAAESLRAQRQAWEEEEAKLGARIEHLKAVVREYAPESTAASAETLPVTAIEVRIEEDRQSLASLRKENARLQRDCSGLDDVATGLRARVEELEGVHSEVIAAAIRTAAMLGEGPDCDPLVLVHRIEDASARVLGELQGARAALSSLGEQESGEVRGE